MALFSFGKKKEEPAEAAAPPPAAGGLPVNEIMTMRQQGFPDNQIIDQLQSMGYNPSQVNDAMNQVNMSQQGSMPPGNMMPPQPEPQMPGNPLGPDPYPQQPDISQGQGLPQDVPPPQFPQVNDISKGVTDKERITELAEAIIDEKWDEIVRDINKVIEWKESTEARINKIEQGIADLKESMESLNRSVVAKISDYDKGLNNVGVEIKAMEKVFQKILPTLTESVNRLERIGKKK